MPKAVCRMADEVDRARLNRRRHWPASRSEERTQAAVTTGCRSVRASGDGLVLASASPRRQAILTALGAAHRIEAADIDETQRAGEPPQQYVVRMAREKAVAVAGRLGRPGLTAARPEGERVVPTGPGRGSAANAAPDTETALAGGVWILGGDTTVVCAGETLGKPRDKQDARRMLRLLRAHPQEVISAVALSAPDGSTEHRLEVARLVFRSLSDTELEAYVASGEGMDKAGGYGLQSGARSFVARMEGGWCTVVGLPLRSTLDLLSQVPGLDVPPAVQWQQAEARVRAQLSSETA